MAGSKYVAIVAGRSLSNRDKNGYAASFCGVIAGNR
jgi:hypothetical protein